MDRIRRVVDRGPLHPDKSMAKTFADQLRSTGLYESVTVEGSAVKGAPVVPDDPFDMKSETPFPAAAEKSLDDLSGMLQQNPAEASAPVEAAEPT